MLDSLQSLSGLSPTAMLILYLVAINAAAYIAFGLDKYFARTGRWRISESTLLLLTFLGGSPGALIAIRLFRHKTKKQPFRLYLHTLIVLQVAVLIMLLFPSVRTIVFDALSRLAAMIS